MSATKYCGFHNNLVVKFSTLGEKRPDNTDLHVSIPYYYGFERITNNFVIIKTCVRENVLQNSRRALFLNKMPWSKF